MTNKEIEQVAAAVFEQYVQKGNSHKNLYKVMDAEHIKFREIHSQNARFVGALTSSINGQYYIMVNKDIANIGRKNFTIAHELGHYCLKHQLLSNLIYCCEDDVAEESQAAKSIEREANHFASCFLMPEQKVKSAFFSMLKNSRRIASRGVFVVKKDSSFGVWRGICDELTKRYGVSEEALRNRLRYLGLAQFYLE